jgi:hypothetical protein
VRLDPPQEPPQALRNLLYGTDRRSKYFQEHIRKFNSALAFASLIVDEKVKPGIPMFAAHGSLYHMMGPLLNEQGYHIHDTNKKSRIICLDSDLDLRSYFSSTLMQQPERKPD